MARRIVITSGKGGVGKTTICAFLGMKLADLGFRVVIVDMDIGLNNLDVVLGLDSKVCFDIVDVIAGNCRLKQALVQHPKYPSLYILPSTHSYDEAYITKEQANVVVDSLAQSFDYILIDSPAGVEEGFRRAVYLAREAIVVATPHISSIRDADKVLSILSRYDLLSKYLVVNRIRGDLVATSETLDLDEIVRFLRVKLLGAIPEEDEIAKQAEIGYMNSHSYTRAISLLAENVHNGTRKIYDCSQKYRGFWGILRRNIKRRI
ncbi:MAG: septum site-determining protein MinD [Clostridia bacterium]|nr:septum site-determining protein MinD [Clostridia bacterium]